MKQCLFLIPTAQLVPGATGSVTPNSHHLNSQQQGRSSPAGTQGRSSPAGAAAVQRQSVSEYAELSTVCGW